MPSILKSNFRRGGIHQLSARWLNTVANILNGIEGIGCFVERDTMNVRWRINTTQPTSDSGDIYSWKIWLRNRDGKNIYEWRCTSDGEGAIAGSIKLQDGEYQDVSANGWTEYDPLVDFDVYLKLTMNPAGVNAELIAYPDDNDPDVTDPLLDEDLNPAVGDDVVVVYELASVWGGKVYQWLSDDIILTGLLLPPLVSGWVQTTADQLLAHGADGALKWVTPSLTCCECPSTADCDALAALGDLTANITLFGYAMTATLVQTSGCAWAGDGDMVYVGDEWGYLSSVVLSCTDGIWDMEYTACISSPPGTYTGHMLKAGGMPKGTYIGGDGGTVT